MKENNQNVKINKRNTSGVKGVMWNEEIQKWHAYIDINKKQKQIGYFKSLEDAKKARQIQAKIEFGEFLHQSDKN